ncbi:MAG TPA: Smr/MutS family protein [Burkholderiales bacterium]|nr:Smr/MutS family protein [Burkholderiales bacterium]
MRKRPAIELSDDEIALFRDAVHDTTPIRPVPRVPRRGKAPPPVPVQSLLDGHDTIAESLAGSLPSDPSVETGRESSYLRAGLGRDVLRKLRRGHWVVQDVVDLHGLNREEARLLLAEFLLACLKRGLRCVRVVHGKGLRSPGKEPVLKAKVQVWLMKRDEVLAFCEAPTNQGGSGALLVLLRAHTR